jgi:subtilisin family serine protease
LLCLFATSASAAQLNTVTLRIPTEDLPRLADISILNRIDYEGFSIVEVTASAATKLDASALSADTIVGLQERKFDTRTGPPAVASAMRTVEKPGTLILYLVQLRGPAKPEWITQIQDTGAKIVGYIPQNTYLVWLDPACIQTLGHKSFIRWKGAYHPAYKIAKVLERIQGTIDISVLIYGDKPDDVISEIKSLGATFIRKADTPFSGDAPGTMAWFAADTSLVTKIAKLPKVVRIDKANIKPGLDDEVACQTVVDHTLDGVPYANPSYQSWLAETGFNGSGSRVAVVDTGCDTNDNTTAHQDLRGRLTIIHYPLTPDAYGDPNGHGTHVAGIIAGNATIGATDENGFLYGQGVAPGANLLIQNAIAGPFPPDGSWETLTRDAVRNQAFVSNNSWYWDSTPGIGYTLVCREFDSFARDADRGTSGNQPLSLVFSVGNVGPEPQTINDPKEAKNIITVGASQNYRPDGPLEGECGPSNNINGMASFSSRGPCVDGRIAPTVVAPGTNISSAVSYDAVEFGAYNDPYSNCKLLATPDYAWMSGTSQAAPMVSGALAVIGQWWRTTHSGANPSPAMCKAIIVNSADDIAGGPDGRGGTLAHIPNGDQGWGRLNIQAAINPQDTFYDDQSHIFTATGQTRRYQVQAVDPNKPLKITITWTDAPGFPGAYAWVNDLDLSVISGTTTYRGNVFSNGWSVDGGTHDYKNNVECVYIEHPTGSYWVTVTAVNIPGDGIPGNSTSLDQDYAIVIRNGCVGGEAVVPYETVTQTTAAHPDYYKAAIPTSGWFAIGIRPSQWTDSDLLLFTEAGFSNQVASSTTRGSGLDFIAIDGNRGLTGSVHALASNFSGSTGYQIQLATKTVDLYPGMTVGGSFGSSDILKSCDINCQTAATCAIRVQPISGQLDLGLSVFGSTSGITGTYYKGRSQRLAEIDSGGIGQPETLYFQIPAGGRYGVVIWCKGGNGNYTVQFDDDPPTPANIIPDYTYTTDFSKLAATWSASDPDTGIARYDYCIGTAPGLSDVIGWTNVGNYTRIVQQGLSLVSGKKYYFTVRATNGIGMTSQASSSSILAVQSIPTIPVLKGLPDGVGVIITSKATTAAFAGKFYISEQDRASGIGIIWTPNVAESRLMTVVGTMTTIDGERFIQATQVYDLGSAQ